MKKLKIMVIIPPFTTIPVIGRGGTERIAEGVINELILRGHNVTLIGCGNCQTKAKFIQIFDKTISKRKFDDAFIEVSRPLRIETAYITRVMHYLLKHGNKYDVVYNHLRGGYLLLPLQQFIKTPIISTLHLPLFEEVVSVLSQHEQTNMVTISNSQRKPAGDRVNFLATIYNGLDLNEFPFNDTPEDYFLFMGAMGEHKSPHLAIEAARGAGVKLILAGGKKREPYFSQHILPQIDGDQINYVGEVTGAERIRLFQKARGFLFPITWEEPFGLVVIEALACGTPVIALNHGAMLEIITDGQDGYVVNSVEEMVAAIRKISQIDRRSCRRKVETKFTYEKMVDGYLAALEKIKGGR